MIGSVGKLQSVLLMVRNPLKSKSQITKIIKLLRLSISNEIIKGNFKMKTLFFFELEE
jgi:hypothetical protein